jgi:hypothetical protein
LQFVWGVVDKDEKILSQLPPGPVVPGTFLHFLQQGDLSDEALAAFDPEALEIKQSLLREIEKKNMLDLSEWHAEWLQHEQQQKDWVTPRGTGASRSLLMQSAHIDLGTHDDNARSAALNYWGDDDDAPDGTLGQKKRWAQEAQVGKHRGTAAGGVQPAPVLYPEYAALNQYAIAQEDSAKTISHLQSEQMRGHHTIQERHQKQCTATYHCQQCGHLQEYHSSKAADTNSLSRPMPLIPEATNYQALGQELPLIFRWTGSDSRTLPRRI